MAVPLRRLGYDVHYVLISDRDESGETREEVKFQMLKLKTYSTNRYLNFLLKRLNPNNNYAKLFEKTKALEADIYHFHDLWINRIGGKLKALKHNPVVFYDAREPYAEDYVSYIKPWPGFEFFIRIFAFYIDAWEKKKSKQYDLVISNEETVQKKFAKTIGNDKAKVLYNYSDALDDFKDLGYEKKKYDLIYSGAISELRGAYLMLEGLLVAKQKIPDIQMVFLGRYYPEDLKHALQYFIDENGLTSNVSLKDVVPYREVAEYYNRSRVGLVLLQKVKTYEISMPIKLFEYMSFGLPVIASNFGHMKKYVDKDSSGILVAPHDPDQVGAAIIELLSNRKLYEACSQNGRKAAIKEYRWEFEFKKLLSYYNQSLNER
jgi:glycosyltransferase involved in cell wall biosynthesis